LRKKKCAIESEYMIAVDKVLTTYKEKVGVRYPFQKKDGKIVKEVLANYGLDSFCALWQEFLEKDWNWYNRWNQLVKVTHDLMNFRSRLTRMLEDGSYKKRIKHIPTHPEFDFGGMVKKI
jgi:hypothetical protein